MWSVRSVWSVSIICLNQTNQMNQRDQMNPDRNHFAARGGDLVHLVFLVSLVSLVVWFDERGRQDRPAHQLARIIH